jgi:broad specificity phosphatase PhoE
MKLTFVRHGESECNVLQEISNRGFRHPLTEKGRQQAVELAQHLQGSAVSGIYTSPLMRAVQTAQVLGEAFGLPVEITDALREYDCGMIEGRSDDEAWQIWKDLRRRWFEEGDWSARIETGESFLDVQARFVPLIEKLVEEHGETTANVVLIGHGGTYTCGMPLVMANTPLKYVLEHGFPHTEAIVAEVRLGRLVCISWCGEPVGQ